MVRSNEIVHVCSNIDELSSRREWLAANIGHLGVNWDHDPAGEVVGVTLVNQNPLSFCVAYRFWFARHEDSVLFNMVWG